MKRCKAMTKSGKRCRAPALRNSDYCVAHDPFLADKRLEWRRQGGRSSSKKAALAEAASVKTPEQVRDVLARTLEALERGDVDPQTANAIARTCNLLLRAIKDTELSERIKRLEEAIMKEPVP